MGLLSRADGYVQTNPAEEPQLEAAGAVRCYTSGWKKPKGSLVKIPCPFWLTDNTQAVVTNSMGGYYTCPICQHSYDLMHHLAWHGVTPDEAEANQREDQQGANWGSGGGTAVGLPMTVQAEIGEELVRSMSSLGQYGPITWWHPGGAAANSPLDGAVKDWGIEVKTIGMDTKNHRFVPGGKRVRADGTVLDEKAEKNQQAVDMGKLGVLGVLVMLDYRRSLADIYVREYPTAKGVGAFRTSAGEKLVAEIPFKNPIMDPHDPAPHVQPGKSAFAEEDIGF